MTLNYARKTWTTVVDDLTNTLTIVIFNSTVVLARKLVTFQALDSSIMIVLW